jgi:hypothetical protein
VIAELPGTWSPSAGTSSRSEKGSRLLLAAVCAVLVSLPFLAVQFPPIADLPQHAAQIRLLGEVLRDPGGPYQLQWMTPYSLSYAVLGLTWLVGSPESAGRLAMLVVGLLWTFTAHALAWRKERPQVAAVLVTVAFFNHGTYWGFVSFLVGWPIFALVWLPVTSGPRLHRVTWSDSLLLGAGSALLYCSHALWLAVGAGWLTVSLIAGRVERRTILLKLACLVPMLSVAAIWYRRLTTGGFDSPTTWLTLPTARLSVGWLTNALFGGLQGPLEVLLLATLAVWALTSLVTNRRTLSSGVDRVLLLAGGFLFVLALLLPDKHTNTIAFASRWVPCAVVLLVLALPAPRGHSLIVQGAALGLVGLLVLTSMLAWRQMENTEFSGLRESLTALPPRPRVLGLDFVKHSVFSKGRPFLQIFAYAQVYRGGTLNFSFAEFRPSLVVYQPPRSVHWTHGLEWFAENVKPVDYAYFDYALVNALEPMHEQIAIGPMLRPVTSAGRWRLYRIEAGS